MALVAQVLEEGTDAVGAHFHLGAVSVEDLHAEVGGLGGPQHQQLIGADAEVAVAEAGRQGLEVRQTVAHTVEHDEVVARTVHLREAQPLRHGVSRDASWSCSGSSQSAG